MDKPIRILHVLGRLDRGGAETMVMNLYRNINRSEIQFDFVKHTDEKCDYDTEIYELGGQIYTVPRYTGTNHLAYKRAWRKLFRENPEYEIIHGHVRSTGAIYLKIAKEYGLVTISHSHSTSSRGNMIEKVIKKIMQFPIRYTADYLFACSDDAGKWLFGNKAIHKNNYKVIKNAIDVDKYLFSEAKREQIRKMLGCEEKFVVGHVGNFTHPKNHKFIIDVFYEVKKQKENAALLLVGDGELKKTIEKQIDKLALRDRVILVGNVPNVNDYLQAMDVFIFPSIFEGLGISVIEAQVSGLPCVISDNIPQEAFLTDLIYSLLLESDPHIWSNQILAFYGNERKATLEIDRIKKSGYDIENSSKRLASFYTRMV